MGNDQSKSNVSKTQSTTITHTAPPSTPRVLWGASGDKSNKDKSSSPSSPRGSTSDKKKSGSTKDRSDSKKDSDDKSRRRDHSSERHKSRDRDKDRDRDRDKDRDRRDKHRSKSKDKSRSHSRDKHKHKHHHTHEPPASPIFAPPPPPPPIIQPAMAIAVDHPPDYRTHRPAWNDMGHYPPPVAHAYADILETIRQERMHLEMLRSQFDEWRFAHQVQLAHQMMDVSYHRRLLDDYKAELDRYQYDAQHGSNGHSQGWDSVMSHRAELDRYYQQLNMHDSSPGRGQPMSPTQSPFGQYGGYGSPPFSPRQMY